MAERSHPLIEPAAASERRPSATATARPPSHLGDRSLVVVPTYNEGSNVAAVVEAILSAAPLAHVLVVDDASPDGTGVIVAAMAAREPRLHVLSRAGKLGLGSAYVAGFRWGLAREFDRFFEMDADFSHDPGELWRLFGELDAGAEVVLGSRRVAGGAIHGWGPGRRFMSRGGSAYSRLVLGIDVQDLTTGYKAFTRRALETVELGAVCSNGYAFQIEMTYRAIRAGLRVVEVPITFVDRRVGRSKMDHRIFAEAVGVVWRLRLSALRRC